MGTSVRPKVFGLTPEQPRWSTVYTHKYTEVDGMAPRKTTFPTCFSPKKEVRSRRVFPYMLWPLKEMAHSYFPYKKRGKAHFHVMWRRKALSRAVPSGRRRPFSAERRFERGGAFVDRP